MRSLCTCAALAVATAFAHGHFADAFLRASEIRKRSITDGKLAELVECFEEISAFRKNLYENAEAYEKDEAVGDATDTEGHLQVFLGSQTCEALESGKFRHLVGESEDDSMFVITAKKSEEQEPSGKENCTNALTQWQSGFSAFGKKPPPVYKDHSEDSEETNVYATPDAAALVSLLHPKAQKVTCGTISECDSAGQKFFLCYFKPSGIKAGVSPVDIMLWRGLEAQQNFRPKLQLPKKEEGDYKLDAVNEVRRALKLEDFKEPEVPDLSEGKRAVESDTLQPAIEKFLYGLTCDDLSKPNLSSAQPEEGDFTVIYYIKDVKGKVEAVPTLNDAVSYWKEGFKALQYKRPPAFKKEKLQGEQVSAAGRQAEETSNIYNNSAVAGYAAIMADGEHYMACVVVSGCEKPDVTQSLSGRSSSTAKDSKSGLICVIHKATLKEKVRPISQQTWVEIMRNEGHPIPNFKQLDASSNCLQEMNAVRTQEKLGLKPFVPKTPATTARSGSQTELVLSSVMESVTCKAIGGEGAESSRTTGAETTSAGPWLEISDDKSSLMYHTYTGDEKTCSAAVEAWKKGFEKFSAAPPAYKTTEPVYQDAAARNFVSLISEGEKTEVTCYETNCTKNGIVCELSPAALREDQTPVSADTWTKYTAIVAEGEGQGAGAGAGAGAGGNAQPESSGVAGYSKAALVGTVVMTLAGGVFFM